MNINTTWAEHHGTAAVEALIARHPSIDANAIRADPPPVVRGHTKHSPIAPQHHGLTLSPGLS
jgi:hypothetical protein